MNVNLQKVHNLCCQTYDELVGIPLDDRGQGASYEAAAVVLAALNQLRDSVFWGDKRDRVQHLEPRKREADE